MSEIIVQAKPVIYVPRSVKRNHHKNANNDFRTAAVAFNDRVNGYQLDLAQTLASSWTKKSALNNAPEGAKVTFAFLRDIKTKIDAAVEGKPNGVAQYIREAIAVKAVEVLDERRPAKFTREAAQQIWGAASSQIIKAPVPKPSTPAATSEVKQVAVLAA